MLLSLRFLRWFSLLLLIFLLGVGCKKQASSKKQTKQLHTLQKGYPVKVTDDRGQTIIIRRKPTRIVVGGTPLYTEILLDLGAKKIIVGMTDSTNQPKESKSIPSVGRSWPLSVERVLGRRPDLVLCALGSARKKLELDAKVTVFTGGGKGGGITSLKDLYQLIQNIDRIVYGHTQRSTKLLKKMKHSLKQLQRSIGHEKLVSAAIIYMPKAKASKFYFVGGKGSSASELLRMAKGRNVFAKQTGGISSIEALLAKDPTVILTDPKQRKNILTHPILSNLRAVKQKRVVGIRASHYTSTRITRVYRQLIQALHPTQTKP